MVEQVRQRGVNLPACPVRERQIRSNPPLVLNIAVIFPRAGMNDTAARLEVVAGKPQEEIRTRRTRSEASAAEIVKVTAIHKDEGIEHLSPANVDAPLQGMLARRVGEIVNQLCGLVNTGLGAVIGKTKRKKPSDRNHGQAGLLSVLRDNAREPHA